VQCCDISNAIHQKRDRIVFFYSGAYQPVLMHITTTCTFNSLQTWLSKYAGGDVPFIKNKNTNDSVHMPAAVTKTELFDVYKTHTKDCIHCMKGMCTTTF
jgi:hypothetical protein